MSRKGWLIGGVILAGLAIFGIRAETRATSQNSLTTLENSVAQVMGQRAPYGSSGPAAQETCSPVPGVSAEYYCVGKWPDGSTLEWTVDVNSSGAWVTVP